MEILGRNGAELIFPVKFWPVLGAALWLWAGIARADAGSFSPFYSRHRLIAGAGDPGFRDGNFVRAAFQKPMGLAVSPDGTRLYVADSGNHAIRSIDLARQNRVTTVCGDGVEGDADSAASTLPARLRQPTDVVVSRDNGRLYIYDRGNRKIKVWDLQHKVLSTIFNLIPRKDGAAGSLGLLLNAQETHLGFIDSQEGSLYVGELKTGALHRVFQDPLLAEAGVQLAYSDGRLRLLAAGRKALYSFTAEGKELDSGSMGSLSEGAKVLLKLITETRAGLQGFTGMGAAPQHQGVMTWDADFATFRLFENPMSSVLGMPNSLGVPAALTVSGSAQSFFKGPLSLGYDPVRCMIYVSEQTSNRVLAVRDDSQGSPSHPLWFNHDYPKEKPVGVTRIVMFGCSGEFHSNEEPELIDQFMSTQLELYLNTMSALQGRGQQFEVVHAFFRGRIIGAGEIWSMEHPEILRDYHADYVLFPMDIQSLWWDIGAWNTVQTQDDVPLRTQDAEWSARSPQARMAGMGPLTQAMVDYCKAEPKACDGLISFPAGEAPIFNFWWHKPLTFFSQPHLRDLALQVEGQIGAKLVKFCAAEKVKPIAFILPIKEYVGGSNNDMSAAILDADLAEAHAGALQAQGLPAYAIIEPIRAVEAALYPLWNKGDGHFRHEGMQWVAYMMAWKFLKELKGPL